MNMGEQEKLSEYIRAAADKGDVFAGELVKKFYQPSYVGPARETLEAAAEDGIAIGAEMLKLRGELDQEQLKVANLEGEIVNLQKQIQGHMSEHHEVEQTLGQALGYPWYRDDEKNFPDATDADGVCTGEHTPSTISLEAARKITELKKEIEVLKETMFTQEHVDNMQAQIDEAREAQVSLFDQDYPPRASQGAPRHDIEDVITAEMANFWIQRITELTQSNADLQQSLDARYAELQAANTQTESIRNAMNEHARQATWRASKIGHVEGLLRWALRKIILDRQTPLSEQDRTRANRLFEELFPDMHYAFRRATRPTIAPRPLRVNVPGDLVGGINRAIPTPPRHNDGADAVGYAMAAQPAMAERLR